MSNRTFPTVVLGLTGYATSGKDAVGAILVQDYGFQRVSFADAVREEAFANHGWDGKKDDAGRRLLQEVGGTPETRDPNKWINVAFAKIDGERVVFTDVRYPNEAESIRGIGGSIVRVTRPFVGPVNDHASEMRIDLIQLDWRIVNDRSLDDLKEVVGRMLEDLYGIAPVEVAG